MLKKLCTLLLLLTSLYSADKVEIYAGKLDSKDAVVSADDGVSVLYGEYIITSDKAIYNRASGDLELTGHVRVNKGREYKLLGKYAKINIAKKKRLFHPFYMSDKATKLWISAGEGRTDAKKLEIDSGVLSGCNPVDPIWQIEFTSSDYNFSDKWMNIYNARLYIEDIPVFYTPYFGYSLNKTRKTGLLMPSFGYSSDEGIYYEQPIYIAEQNWWDLELRPQIRTKRGKGIYETFRFVDSANSKGEFRAGIFKEKDDYFDEKQLTNQTHYGFHLKYNNNNFLNQWFGLKLAGQSLIYTDINFMNDVEYLNLSSNNTQDTATATQVLSRVNMVYNADKHYVGAYFKYYQDLTISNNDVTLQKLPTLQYHYYLDTFLEDHLLYNIDIQANNITRIEGTNAVQTNINLPVRLQTSLFDEYLNLSYKANIYMQHSSFSKQSTGVASLDSLNNGYILRNYHTLAVNTQLTRGYEDFSHVIGFGISYNMTGTESKDGYYSENEDFCADPLNKFNPNDPSTFRCEFYNISPVQDEAQLEFIQYIYNEKAEQVLYHRLSQLVSNSKNETRYGELENELDYYVTTYLNFYNNMFYNYKEQNFSKIFNKISLSRYSTTLALSHLYKDSFDSGDPLRYTSYLTSTLSYTYDKHYSFSGLYNYDFEARQAKTKEIGFMYKKRCWDFGIRLSETRRPITTVNGDSFIDERYLYFTILLKPIMKARNSSVLTYKFPQAN